MKIKKRGQIERIKAEQAAAFEMSNMILINFYLELKVEKD